MGGAVSGGSGSTGGCGCGGGGEDLPTLVAVTIPAPLRPGAVVGAITGLAPGAGMVLVAPHDPVPIIGMVRAACGDEITHEYVDREGDLAAGGDVRVRFVRRAGRSGAPETTAGRATTTVTRPADAEEGRPLR